MDLVEPRSLENLERICQTCQFSTSDWEDISAFQQLSETFMDQYQDKLNWELITGFQALSEKFIEKHKDKFGPVEWLNLQHNSKVPKTVRKKISEQHKPQK